MIKHIAIIENDTIKQIIVCKTLTLARKLIPDTELVNVTGTGAAIGWVRYDGGFRPAQPSEDHTWNEELKEWELL